MDMTGSCQNRRVARQARNAPWMSLQELAEGAVIQSAAMLNGLGRRGRCDTALMDATPRLGSPERAAVVASRWCPPPLRRLGGADSSNTVRMAAAGVAGWAHRARSDIAAPRRALVAELGSGWVDVQRRLNSIRNPSCPPAVSACLAGDIDAAVRSAAAWNPDCDASTLWRLAADRDADTRAVVAERTTHASVLGHLAADDHAMVRYSAAKNPHCDRETTRHIFEDPEVDADAAVWAYRPDSTVEELQNVVESATDWWVLAAVGAHPGCGAGLRERLAASGEALVRAAVARNRFCDPELLERFAGDDALHVRTRASANPLCSAATLRRLAADNDVGVRAAAAANPNISASVLRRLGRDSNADVRAVALHAVLERFGRRAGSGTDNGSGAAERADSDKV